MTITTPRREIAEIIEPYAPSFKSRLSALKRIADEGIPTVVRIDPVIPTVNSNDEDLEAIILESAEIGVKQITVSTLKPVKGFFRALKKEHPRLFERLREAYRDGEWIMGYKYLNREVRLKIVERIRKKVLSYGLAFATCREGFSWLNTNICDGTAYCRSTLERFMN